MNEWYLHSQSSVVDNTETGKAAQTFLTLSHVASIEEQLVHIDDESVHDESAGSSQETTLLRASDRCLLQWWFESEFIHTIDKLTSSNNFTDVSITKSLVTKLSHSFSTICYDLNATQAITKTLHVHAHQRYQWCYEITAVRHLTIKVY